MKNKIIKLSENVINQIAAGEVIERPASVMKELIENSIDASSANIKIYIMGSGRDCIKVIDDGIGINEKQLVLALERHATSKLDSSDLTKINFLGFRGEALPSIASISDFSISSIKKGLKNGWELNSYFGKVGNIKPSRLKQGTSIEVKNLFKLTPARLKFLKTDRTETGMLIDMFKKLSIVNSETTFQLFIDGVERLNFLSYSSNSIEKRICDVVGKEFYDNSIAIESSRGDASIRGLIGIPTYSKGSGRSQYIYVNGRAVSDRLITGAIRGAYSDYLPRNRFPILSIFIDVAPESLDVNVHPNKAEVRFENEQNIRALIVGSIKKALFSSGLKTSNVNSDKIFKSIKNKFPSNSNYHYDREFSTKNSDIFSSEQSNFREIDINNGQFSPSGKTHKVGSDNQDYPLGSAVAQVHKNYIVSQTLDGLILIDQHAAHERIVYEEIKRAIFGKPIKSQAILIPEIVELDELSISILSEHIEEFKKLGLLFDINDSKSIIVNGTPDLLGEVNILKLVKDLSENLMNENNSQSLKGLLDEVCSAMACHGSVRAGRELDIKEMNALLRKMEITPNSGQCNHGRPTYVKLELIDIESIFGRR
ncbi:MAG: DNA mismatch repair protein MutL [Alphaproteobacteria bacterium MarineAlpha2_Bin1]|nr:MAG: DNA mismatch repair protein MutL [Alphaproteobacteria bacterium MarineAlpha2_Bin1]